MSEAAEMREMMEEMGEELAPRQRVWRHLRRNPMAMAGGAALLLFLGLAALGFVNSALMSEPLFDANVVRLPDKLKAPFSAPNAGVVPKGNLPRLGIYLFGTDDLGRDVFARMLEGTFISMSVGFVAIGIATLLGVAIGGVAGFYGELKPSGAPLFGFAGAALAGYAVWNEAGFLALLFCAGGAGAGLATRRAGRSLFLERSWASRWGASSRSTSGASPPISACARALPAGGRASSARSACSPSPPSAGRRG